MSNSITLTVPTDDDKALQAAATMLLTLCGKLPELDMPDYTGQDSSPGPAPAAETLQPHTADVTAAETSGPAPAPAPQPEPAAEQPAAPAPQATAQAAGSAEVDADGLPWDARIHASTKAVTSQGKWKKKRGIDDATKQQVEAELRQLMAVPAPEPAAEQPGTPAPGPAPAPAPAPQPDATQTQAPAPAPAPAPAAEQPAEPAAMTFPEFLKTASGMVSNGQITMDRVTEIVQGHGVPNIQGLSARADLIPQIWNDIQLSVQQA